MGDLHLEIARDRLLNDFKAKARIGKIEIGYRETITTMTATEPFTYTLDKLVAGKQTKASITASVESTQDTNMIPLSPLQQQEKARQIQDNPFETTYNLPDNNTLHIIHPDVSTQDFASHKTHIPPHLSLPGILHSLQAGASAALARGPFNGFPVANTRVTLTLDAKSHLFPETTPTAISMAVRAAVSTSLRTASDAAPAALMEPVMNVTIFVNEKNMGAVVQDITSSRGGQIISLDGSDDSAVSTTTTANGNDEVLPRIDPALIYSPPDPFASGMGDMANGLGDSQRQIVARVPLKEMVGYLNQLRALTGGRGTFVMSVDGFEKMGTQRQKEVLDALREF
jgi:elongation factor G